MELLKICKGSDVSTANFPLRECIFKQKYILIDLQAPSLTNLLLQTMLSLNVEDTLCSVVSKMWKI